MSRVAANRKAYNKGEFRNKSTLINPQRKNVGKGKKRPHTIDNTRQRTQETLDLNNKES